jgi:hypothetical protein
MGLASLKKAMHEVTRRFYEPLFLYHVIKRN